MNTQVREGTKQKPHGQHKSPLEILDHVIKDKKKKNAETFSVDINTQVRSRPSSLLDSNRNSEEGFVGKCLLFFQCAGV